MKPGPCQGCWLMAREAMPPVNAAASAMVVTNSCSSGRGDEVRGARLALRRGIAGRSMTLLQLCRPCALSRCGQSFRRVRTQEVSKAHGNVSCGGQTGTQGADVHARFAPAPNRGHVARKRINASAGEAMEFDDIIVGGGSAVRLANRLSARGANKVLVCEAGEDTPPGVERRRFWILLRHRLPQQLASSGRELKASTRLLAERRPTAPKPRLRKYEQARVLGGGSSISEMRTEVRRPTMTSGRLAGPCLEAGERALLYLQEARARPLISTTNGMGRMARFRSARAWKSIGPGTPRRWPRCSGAQATSISGSERISRTAISASTSRTQTSSASRLDRLPQRGSAQTA